MEIVKVSPNFEIIIPRKVCELLNIQPGQKLQLISLSDRIVLIPETPIQEARGFLRGIKTSIEREQDRV